MRSRRDAILLAVLVTLLAAVAIILRPHAGEVASEDPRASTYLIGPRGTRALFLLMEELALPVDRELRPWTSTAAPGVIVVLSPAEDPTPREVNALLGWVRQGGTLVYAAGNDRLGKALELPLRAIPIPDSLGALDRVRWLGATSRPTNHPFAAGIDSIRRFRGAFRETPALRATTTSVLMRAPDGSPTVVMYPMGQGRVVAWSSAGPLRNEILREEDAALLFVRTVKGNLAGGGTLRFDEYHQGFREAGPARALWRFLTTTNPGNALLQGIAACLVLLLLAGHRLGAPVREISGRRRSPLEHVDAVAVAYGRAGARRTARRLLVAGLERRLGRRVLQQNGAIAGTALGATAGARQLREQLEAGDSADLVKLAGAVDDYVGEVKRWM